MKLENTIRLHLSTFLTILKLFLKNYKNNSTIETIVIIQNYEKGIKIISIPSLSSIPYSNNYTFLISIYTFYKNKFLKTGYLWVITSFPRLLKHHRHSLKKWTHRTHLRAPQHSCIATILPLDIKFFLAFCRC